MTTTGRRSRLFRRGSDVPDDGDADLSEDEHAWWAARDKVAAVPRGLLDVEPDEVESTESSRFADYWTAESLFEDGAPGAAGPAGPATETPGPDDEDEVPEGMDLDSAHLVLQVSIGASWEEITSAHRHLAKLFHPDRLVDLSPDAQDLGRDRMAEINDAHATLRTVHFH